MFMFKVMLRTELELRVCDSLIMKQFPDPTNQKFVKL